VLLRCRFRARLGVTVEAHSGRHACFFQKLSIEKTVSSAMNGRPSTCSIANIDARRESNASDTKEQGRKVA
jgi:hypothetical protein